MSVAFSISDMRKAIICLSLLAACTDTASIADTADGGLSLIRGTRIYMGYATPIADGVAVSPATIYNGTDIIRTEASVVPYPTCDDFWGYYDDTGNVMHSCDRPDEPLYSVETDEYGRYIEEWSVPPGPTRRVAIGVDRDIDHNDRVDVVLPLSPDDRIARAWVVGDADGLMTISIGYMLSTHQLVVTDSATGPGAPSLTPQHPIWGTGRATRSPMYSVPIAVITADEPSSVVAVVVEYVEQSVY